MDDKKFNVDSYHVINALFNQLEAVFPNFTRAWPTEQILKTAKTNWLLAFVEANINTMRHLQIGLKKARHHPKSWVPSVGEFINWCKPTLKDFGLPEPHIAFKECCTNAHSLKYGENINWSHQAVYHAGSQTGWFDIEKQEKLFMINYDIACKIVFDGGTLRDLPKLISFQHEIKSTPQNALNGLNELKKILGIATIKS